MTERNRRKIKKEEKKKHHRIKIQTAERVKPGYHKLTWVTIQYPVNQSVNSFCKYPKVSSAGNRYGLHQLVSHPPENKKGTAVQGAKLNDSK